MGRMLRWLFLAAVAVGMLTAGSYAGARFTAGRLVGPHTPLAGRSVELALRNDGEELPGQPPAWVFTYRASRLPGVASAKIYVSPTGKLLGTAPVDLGRRVESYERTLMP